MAENMTAVPALSIRARGEDGFNRAKRHWGPQEEIVTIASLAPWQVKALKAEGAKKGGRLVVVETTKEIPAAQAAAEAAAQAEAQKAATTGKGKTPAKAAGK